MVFTQELDVVFLREVVYKKQGDVPISQVGDGLRSSPYIRRDWEEARPRDDAMFDAPAVNWRHIDLWVA